MQYSEYLKFTEGLSMDITREEVLLLMTALSALRLSDFSSHSSQTHMANYNIDDDKFDTNIDIMSEKLRELQLSKYENFLINPMFTNDRLK